MYILKNAITSIKRNLGRNILIGIIIIVVSIAVTITLAIRNSANTIVEAYNKANPLIASISMNRDKVMELFNKGEDNQESNIESFNSIPSLTKEEVVNYGDSKYLESYYYTYTTSLDSDTLVKAADSVSKEVTTKESSTTTRNSGGSRGGKFPGGGGFIQRDTTTIITKTTEIFQNSKIQTGDFSLVGYSSYDAMDDFVNGTYKITEGTLFTDFSSYNCVVNKELATLNELEVGDTFKLKNSNTKDTYTFTVSGIYEEENSNSSNISMYSSTANTIIVSSSIVEEILTKDEELEGSIEPNFILKSENDIENFSNEVTEKGLSEYYQISTNLETIEEETKSISNVKTFATTFLIITLIIGSVVLLVINMINVRERKYEIGVLRTIGMKKSLVISQFIFELLLVSIISLSIGAFGGSLFSVKTANYLLSNEIESATENMENINKNFGIDFNNLSKNNKDADKQNESDSENDLTTNNETLNEQENESNKSKNKVIQFRGITNVSAIQEMNAAVDFKVILQLLGLGLLLTLISSLSAMISISRFSPLTILKERS